MNALTTEEITLFFHTVPSDAIERSIRILGESLCSPLFPEKEIPIQKKIVIHELKTDEDNPYDFLADRWRRRRMKGHPLSQTEGGLVSSIRRFTREHLLGFTKRFSDPGYFNFIAIGEGDPAEVRDLINKHFSFNAGDPHDDRSHPPIPPTPQITSVFHRDVQEAYIFSGAVAGGPNDPNTRPLQLFSFMISGGMSFPFFEEIREERGYCYSVSAYPVEYTDLSYFTITMETSPATHRDALALAFDIMHREKRNEALLERAKGAIRGGFKRISDTGQRLDRAAKDIMLRGAPRTPAEMIADFDAVTIQDVERAVDKYLRPEQFYTAVLLPKKS